jgi:sulfur-carrier protein
MKPDDSRVTTIRMRYFARLREALGVEQEALALPGTVQDVSGLIAWLRTRGGAWERELAPGRPVRVAVNQDMAEAATRIGNGDEVAIFPPVTGG